MSTTSSASRLPLGKPATSPDSNPRRLALPGSVGATPELSRSRSAIGPGFVPEAAMGGKYSHRGSKAERGAGGEQKAAGTSTPSSQSTTVANRELTAQPG